jgi:Flp pilus assembly protein TadD
MTPGSVGITSNTLSRDAESRSLSRWSGGALASLLIVCGAVPYLNTLFNGFVYDDNTQVMNNPYLQSFRYLREIFTTTVWSYIGGFRTTNYYRPMMTFGYLICYQLFGPVSFGFHLASLVLHTTVVCVLFLVTERIFQDRLLAILAAGLFALHPIHTESVAWIAAVTDLELTVFFLLTFWFFLGIGERSGGRSDLKKLGMVGGFVLALLSKEQALTLPVLATVYEHFYRADRAETTPRQKLFRYIELWLLAIAYVLFRRRFFRAFAPVLLRPDLTWYQTVLSAVALVGRYLWKLVWPVQLCAFYVFRKNSSLLDPRVIAGLGALVLCLAIFLKLWHQSRLASFGVVWFVVTLAPVLNARWLPANVFTERYLYLPSVGFCWIVAWGCVRLWALTSSRAPAWRKSICAALGLLAVLCTLRIVTRNRDWRDDVVLYTRTLALQPDAWPIRNNLGVAYWARGNAKGAEQEWRESLKVKADNQIVLSNLGLVRLREKRYAEAVQYFQTALKIDPRMTDAHLRLGEVYLAMDSRKLAELQFRDTVALSPLNTQGRNRLGHLELEAGRLDEAEEQFARSVESAPNPTGFDGLGDIYLKRDARDRAESFFRRALAVDPFDSHAHFKLGALYAGAGRNADAVREYQTGFVMDPHNPEALAQVQKFGLKIPNAMPSRP